MALEAVGVSLIGMNVRQTDAKPSSNPKLHTVPHLQTPHEIDRKGHDRKVDQNGKRLNHDPAVYLQFRVSCRLVHRLQQGTAHCAPVQCGRFQPRLGRALTDADDKHRDCAQGCACARQDVWQ
jgi:hypothetical protein